MRNAMRPLVGFGIPCVEHTQYNVQLKTFSIIQASVGTAFVELSQCWHPQS